MDRPSVHNNLASTGPAKLGGVIHHIGVFASDLAVSRTFYKAALEPLRIFPQYETDRVCEFWHQDADTPSLSLEQAHDDVTRGLHVAFTAADRAAVDAFFAAALATGGRERHSPRHWPEYRAYCAFVSDPDGNNVEAVHKEVGGSGGSLDPSK